MPDATDPVARAMIAQHMDECARNYRDLRESLDRRFDGHDDALRAVNRLLWTVALGALGVLITLVIDLIHGGAHL